MYLIFLDTETTGINPEKHRILDIAYKIVDSLNGRVVVSYSSIVNQTAEVWAEADSESLQVTGFTWEEILKGKTEKVVANEIENDFNHVGLGREGGVFICQNPSFDRAFFLQLINANVQKSYGWPYHWLDLASMYWAVRKTENGEKFRNIKESDLSKDAIAKHFGLPKEQTPHRALNGVNHLMECYGALFGQFAKLIV